LHSVADMMKRCPSFSGRPGFPKGLAVLVVDCELTDGLEAETQLKECGYAPTRCASTREAVAKLGQPGVDFDVMMVEVQCLQGRSPDNTALLAAAKSVPMVLMSSMCSPADVIMGIKRGAVDFLEKPLHLQKLRNIWQHVVRKMMNGGNPTSMVNDAGVAANGTAGSGGRGDGAHSSDTTGGHSRSQRASAANSGAGGYGSSLLAVESGSNESTSAKLAAEEMELDLDAVSLLDEDFMDAVDSVLGTGITNGFSSLLLGDERACGGGGDSHGHATQGISHALPAEQQQPSTSKPPVMGYPAGRLPELTEEGMAWGMPTNPLHITPKLGPMMPPMSLPPWMMPPGMMLPPGPMPNMMPPIFGGMNPPKRMQSTSDNTSLMQSVSNMSCPSDASCEAPPELLHALSKEVESASRTEASAPILGLSLRKSMSLMDLISESLKHASVAG